MKKQILTALICATSMVGMAQKKPFFTKDDHVITHVVTIQYVDSTWKAIDTTYSVVHNISYREIKYNYSNLGNQKRQCYIKYSYNGENWLFYQFRDEPLTESYLNQLYLTPTNHF